MLSYVDKGDDIMYNRLRKLLIAQIIVGSLAFVPNHNDLAITTVVHAESSATQKFNQGIAYFKRNQFDEAIWSFSEAIELNPEYIDAYFYRGLSWATEELLETYPGALGLEYHGHGFDVGDPIKDFNKVIQMKPNNFKAYFNRGILYLFRNGNPQQAISDLNRAIEINPYYAEAYCERGNAYYKLQNYNQAIVDYNKAIQLNPNYARAYLCRGGLYERKFAIYGYKSEDYQNAMTDYNKAISLEPNNDVYGKALESFLSYCEEVKSLKLSGSRAVAVYMGW